ncbi:DUF1080 domain-containing protein [Muriicola sp. Z0-33]|uniref:3-keto-disaccharide hydrolase n=1 Tax=Muriicola sp. Z0-33 TaxID=2816957 RepID=UPI00223810ED|nr:DUF1080 domain-containing protein [Muriicola sp. Z0-33]MCW5516590.1 DUF1080 domain-containing protein [Muriicola sp. Z0-33]
MKTKFILYSVITFMILSLSPAIIFGQDENPLEGRWNLSISQEGKELPSWLEIRHSGTNTLVGRFVYAFGSARPIAEVKLQDGKFSFEIPPQWEPGKTNMKFEGALSGEKLMGTMVYTDGKSYDWEASRSPELPHNANPVWGESTALFNGKDLSGWQAMGENQWQVTDGILTSQKSGANLVSDQKFTDFKLNVEFRYPEGSNSGIYLRGRYEVQIADNKGLAPSDIYFGGVYGFLTPNEMVAKAAGEWQTYEITLIGRRVTIVGNGKQIITDQIIPGMTGGALDNNEAAPGPILIQGDHGPVEFKKITITPVKG